MKIRYYIYTILIAIFMSGCGTPPKFYRLVPKADIHQGNRTLSKNIIGVATVKVADYIDSKQIITVENNPTKLNPHEDEMWLGGLPENIQNTLKIDLSAKIKKYTFLSYPWDEPIDDKYRIYLKIDGINMSNSGEVSIYGKWSIVDMDRNKLIKINQFSYSSECIGDSYSDKAEALSILIDRVSSDIADEIKRL